MIPLAAIADARAAQQRTGASDHAVALALAVAGPESGWKASAEGDYVGGVATSFGYTQLSVPSSANPSGGLGNGHSIDEMLDGPTNFAIAESAIQARLDAGQGDREAIVDWHTRDAALAGLQDAELALGQVSANPLPVAPVALPGAISALPVLSWGSLSPQQKALAAVGGAALGVLVVLNA